MDEWTNLFLAEQDRINQNYNRLQFMGPLYTNPFIEVG